MERFMNTRIDADGVPKVVQSVVYRCLALEITLFNGVRVLSDIGNFQGLDIALREDKAWEGRSPNRTMTHEFRTEMYAAADRLLEAHPELGVRDDLPTPIKRPLELVPMED